MRGRKAGKEMSPFLSTVVTIGFTVGVVCLINNEDESVKTWASIFLAFCGTVALVFLYGICKIPDENQSELIKSIDKLTKAVNKLAIETRLRRRHD